MSDELRDDPRVEWLARAGFAAEVAEGGGRPQQEGATRVKLECEFDLGDVVKIDGGEGGTITAVVFRKNGILKKGDYQQYEVSWISNGDSKAAWFEGWRLEKKE